MTKKQLVLVFFVKSSDRKITNFLLENLNNNTCELWPLIYSEQRMSVKRFFGNYQQKINELELILSSLDTGLSIINADHTISWVNKKIYDMYPRADPIGKIYHRFYESSDEPCESCPTLQCFKNGLVHHLERYNPAKDRWYRIIAQPIKDSDRQVVRVIEGGD